VARGQIPGAVARVSGMFEGESISFSYMLAPNRARFGSAQGKTRDGMGNGLVSGSRLVQSGLASCISIT